MMKRALDLGISTVALVVLSPLLLLTAALIRLDDAGPALYAGRRVGLNGQPFDMLKFRTMVVDADKIGGSSTASGDPRLTRVGRVLRRFKLDELPQFVNVVKGDMSLVGPRPQVQWAVDTYTSEERAILTVRPGITDLASIRFANEAEILKGAADPDRAYMELIHPEKMRLAREYVEHASLWLDIKILAATCVAAVWPRRS